MTSPKIPQKSIKTGLRLPANLYDDIAAAAEANCLSLNAEIITRLQAGPALEEIKRHNARIEEMQRQILILLQE
jgi:hypothetical protein